MRGKLTDRLGKQTFLVRFLCALGFLSLALALLLLGAARLHAEGQVPSTLGGSAQRTPGNTSNVYPRELPAGSGVSGGLPPAYADPRFIIRQNPYNSRTEKLDTSIPDGFIYVNGAYFIMGGSQGEYNVKAPGHRVSVNSYWVSPYEIYWKLWNDVLRWAVGRGYKFAHTGRGHQVSALRGLDSPVYNISWYDAIVWCNAYSEVRGLEPVYRYNSTVSNYVVRSSLDRKILTNININLNANGYRLPSEAEWELAARGGVAGQGTLFAGSNHEVDVAWFRNNTLGNGTYARSVGLLRPNELGIYDMNGNLAEWTADWYSEDYYYSSPVENPLGPATGAYRVIRGGSYRSRPKSEFFNRKGKRIRRRETWMAIEMRERLKPSATETWIGFRPVRTAIFRPVDYLANGQTYSQERPVVSTPEALNQESTDSTPYIYSLDPNYRPNSSPYRNVE